MDNLTAHKKTTNFPVCYEWSVSSCYLPKKQILEVIYFSFWELVLSIPGFGL